MDQKPVVLLTGASTGLGLSIARQLIQNGYRTILTARQASLPRFAEAGIFEGENIKLRPLDVMSAEDREALLSEINSSQNSWGPVDILINNAGFAYRSVLEHVEQPELLKQMITNFWGPMELVRGVLPAMRSRRHGKIINISSVGGMMAMPTMSVYSASKFALEGASESLYYEVKPWNISVTLVEPGFINSNSFDKTRYTTLSGRSMRDPSEAYYGHYRFMTQFIAKLMSYSPTKPDDIAKQIMKVIQKKNPPLRVPATWDALIFDWLRRALPRSLYHWALYRNLPFPDCWGDVQRLRVRCHLERDKFADSQNG